MTARQLLDAAASLGALLGMRTWHADGMACAEFGSVSDTSTAYGSYAAPYNEHGGDKMAAERRAIVGAAAAFEPAMAPESIFGLQEEP